MQGAYAAYSLVNLEAPPSGVLKGLTTPPLGPTAHSCVVYLYVYVPNMPAAVLLFGVRPAPVFDSQQSTLKLLGTVNGRTLKGQWRRMFIRVGNWDAGARFVYLANSVGVSIDRPEYNMCHPDSQSEGSEAAEKVSCSFSDPLNCGWFPERKASDMTWALNLGGTEFPKFLWQPSDSDSHKGPYMYAQNLRFAVSSAHLVSIKMGPTPGTGRCFTFWYNMWHPNVGKLNLMKRVENESNSLLWTRSSPQGKEWKQGQVQLFSDDPHQLIFEAVLLAGKRGMIAIDNFVLNDTSCSSDKSGGCNFESDSCGWQMHNWERTSTTRSFKPTADHTTESPTGRFVLARILVAAWLALKIGTTRLSRSASASGTSLLAHLRKRSGSPECSKEVRRSHSGVTPRIKTTANSGAKHPLTYLLTMKLLRSCSTPQPLTPREQL
ncbi:apical endosomal glycoprotein [Rhipicephalus sanguineus]|uniref:apical endosomal glycoprotein n=1 Tax=Rhipicephalus sanguineus TaxID=34632 RepID=UPI0020C47C84|nr:apical endosomal glycoprotein [Rhipicephalus sanguineus]